MLFMLILLFVMYAVMIAFPKYRVISSVLAAVLTVAFGMLPAAQILSVINWNALLMIAGTMVLVHYFIVSKMPNRIADYLLDKAPNVLWVTVLMSLFSGVISSVVDNVATVLMVAPVALALCRKLEISPVPMVLSIAVSSNLQGAATLVGDTTSIMLGSYAGMDFMDFIWMHGRPGIFFAVELGALATIPIMLVLFRKEKEIVRSKEKTEVKEILPTIMLAGKVAALVIASFFKNKPEIMNGIICMAFAAAMILFDYLKKRQIPGVMAALLSIDYPTMVMLGALFVVIGGAENSGMIAAFSEWIVKTGGNNLFVLYSIIVWGSVLISAFVDNIPYVATMLPVISQVTADIGAAPYVLYFGLLCGATLGGNLTPIGASANITAVGMLRQHGFETGYRDFTKVGVPFTLAAVLTGYLFIWFVWR